MLSVRSPSVTLGNACPRRRPRQVVQEDLVESGGGVCFSLRSPTPSRRLTCYCDRREPLLWILGFLTDRPTVMLFGNAR